MTLTEFYNACPKKIEFKAVSDGGLGQYYEFILEGFDGRTYEGVVKIDQLLEFIKVHAHYYATTPEYKVPSLDD